MKRWTSCAWPMAAAACVLAAGCGSSTTSRMSRTAYRANLDECNEVRLVYESVASREGLMPMEKYEELIIRVCPRPWPSSEYSLKREKSSSWPSWVKFDLGEVEARSDAGGQRIWLVDRSSGKIIGSVDRVSGQTTGPGDAPPDWATRDAGTPLASADR